MSRVITYESASAAAAEKSLESGSCGEHDKKSYETIEDSTLIDCAR